jgi:hypothetical protein|tara:strand:+ start:75 stop:335 length:261 start_codon:yes stop_codon:yes gene_type:complete
MNNITDKELEMLEACQDSFEWNEACDKIVSARENKEYPPNWRSEVIESGLMERIRSRWDARAKRRLSRLTIEDVCEHFTDGKTEDE